MESGTLREMKWEDLEKIVDIHVRSFPKFFLTELGENFLHLYYKTAIETQGSITRVLENKKSEIVGFAVGYIEPRIFYKNLKRKRIKSLILLIKSIAKKPRLIPRIIKNTKRVISNSNNEDSYVELASIAAHPTGKGYGKELIKDFIHNARKKGGKSIQLTTDNLDNNKTQEFYERNGFREGDLKEQSGRIMRTYILELN